MNKIMHVSDKALDFLTAWEGFALEPYLDQAHKPTIGIGHLLTPGEIDSGMIKIGDEDVAWRDGITKDQALLLKRQDLALFEKAVLEALSFHLLKQYQFDALVICAFNIGAKGFDAATFVNRIKNNASRFHIEEAWKWWNKVDGQVSNGLTKRRAAEIKLFFDGDYSGRP